MGYQSISSGDFELEVSLGEAYRVMYQFLHDVELRGPGTDLQWLLYAYSGVLPDGTTMDPAAAYDFLAAAKTVLPDRFAEPDDS